MNRILEIPPEKLTPEQTKVFEQLTAGRGRILGPYKIWIHSPTVAAGMERIAIRGPSRRRATLIGCALVSSIGSSQCTSSPLFSSVIGAPRTPFAARVGKR